MRTSRTTPILVGLLVLGAALAAFAPPASAQTQADQATSVTFSKLQGPTEDIQPLVDIKEVTGEVKITYVVNGCALLGNIEVKLTVSKQPSWAQVALAPASLLFTPKGTACQQQQITDQLPFKAFVFASADAPAFKSEALEFKADLVGQSGLKASSTVGQVFIKAGFYSILEARVDNPIQLARPQETVQIPIVITNFGNAPTKVSFNVDSSNKERLVPSQITPVTVQSRVDGAANSQTVVLNAITPYHNG
ncbi:MAG TPA: hypothetical protein VNZ52_15945, partial [Candidatus Thermoplasmatota archaeon]|nr:hypothetical protein [Candidatus Thermoplasmatota archaeon]